MRDLISRFIRDEEGQDIVEYVLLVVFIGLLVTLGMNLLATGLNQKFSDISNTITTKS